MLDKKYFVKLQNEDGQDIYFLDCFGLDKIIFSKTKAWVSSYETTRSNWVDLYLLWKIGPVKWGKRTFHCEFEPKIFEYIDESGDRLVDCKIEPEQIGSELNIEDIRFQPDHVYDEIKQMIGDELYYSSPTNYGIESLLRILARYGHQDKRYGLSLDCPSISKFNEVKEDGFNLLEIDDYCSDFCLVDWSEVCRATLMYYGDKDIDLSWYDMHDKFKVSK